MHSLNLKGKQRKNDKYHFYKGEIGKIADNHFNADKPFEKLTTDVTQFKVCHEKVDLSPVMDLYNREIVSCAISLRPDLQQIRDMPDGLFAKLPNDAAPIFHSDQGWQYQLAEYQRLLSERSIRQSMSRKGNCMDNGAMENFFGRLKVEMFYREHFETVDEFINCLKEYIHYYNNERTVSKLKMSPVNFRTHSLQSSYFLSKLLGSLQFAAVFFCLLSLAARERVHLRLAKDLVTGKFNHWPTLLPTDFGCTPGSSSHFSLPYPQSIPGARNSSRISTSDSPVYPKSSARFCSWASPQTVLYACTAGCSPEDECGPATSRPRYSLLSSPCTAF